VSNIKNSYTNNEHRGMKIFNVTETRHRFYVFRKEITKLTDCSLVH